MRRVCRTSWRHIARVVIVVSATLSILFSSVGAASAYEYQTGPGISCGGYFPDSIVQSYSYGDSNLYSNWGLHSYSYSIPYSQLVYLWNFTGHTSHTVVAGEAENYVESVFSGCDIY